MSRVPGLDGDRRGLESPTNSSSQRVFRALAASDRPMGVDLIAAYTLLPRDVVAQALFELLDSGFVIQTVPGLTDRTIWRGRFKAVELKRRAAG